MRYVVSLAALLASFIGSAFAADVDIDKEHRIANRKGGFCVWCSLETMGRHQGVETLHGLVDRKYKVLGYWVRSHDGKGWSHEWVPNGVAGEFQAIEELKKHKIGFWVQSRGDRNPQILKDACRHRRPCMVAFEWPNQPVGHAVVLVTYNDEFVEVVDSNKPDEVKKLTRKWFDEHWSGTAVVLDVPAKGVKK